MTFKQLKYKINNEMISKIAINDNSLKEKSILNNMKGAGIIAGAL